MKFKNIGINSLFILIFLYIFLVITLSSLIIGKNGMYKVFESQVAKYFTQSLSFAQAILNEKMRDITTSTEAIEIPNYLLSQTYSESLKQYLKEKIVDNLDFLIYLPTEQNKKLITEGIFLYDISKLENKIKNHQIKFAKNEMIIIEQKMQTFVFLLSSKKIISKDDGEVLGTLVGGVELGYQSSFLNAIEKYSKLDNTHLLVNKKSLYKNNKAPLETNLNETSLFHVDPIIITKYGDLLFENVKSPLQLAMSTKSSGLQMITEQLKSDIIIILSIFIVLIMQIVFVTRSFLGNPLIKLKQYAKSLAKENKRISVPNFYITEYKDLALYLRFLFQEFIKSKKIQEQQYSDLTKAKAKLDDNMSLIDKYVITSSTDLEGNIIEASSAFCKISGYTKEELLGKNHRIIKSHKTDAQTYQKLWETISAGEVWEGEICNKAKDGSLYWTTNIIAPIFKDGKIIKYTAFRENITDKKHIQELSMKDVLTSLYNRRYIEEILLNAQAHYARFPEPFCIMMIDIDFFKEVNDNYGHQVGDSVLKEFSELLITNSRQSDKIGRWGGEEFLIYMPNSELEQSVLVAQKLRQKIEEYNFAHVVTKTASFGVAQYEGDIEVSIKKADMALYKAKELGRNQVQYSS